MFRSDVKQNKGNNLTFGVILLALEVMSIKFPLSQMCFLKQILVALFTVAAGNEAGVDSVLIQPFLLYYVNHGTFVLTIIIIMHTFHKNIYKFLARYIQDRAKESDSRGVKKKKRLKKNSLLR